MARLSPALSQLSELLQERDLELPGAPSPEPPPPDPRPTLEPVLARIAHTIQELRRRWITLQGHLALVQAGEQAGLAQHAQELAQTLRDQQLNTLERIEGLQRQQARLVLRIQRDLSLRAAAALRHQAALQREARGPRLGILAASAPLGTRICSLLREELEKAHDRLLQHSLPEEQQWRLSDLLDSASEQLNTVRDAELSAGWPALLRVMESLNLVQRGLEQT